MSKTINIPSIVTAKTYFWSPEGSASGRRYKEKRRQEEIDEFAEEVMKVVPTVKIEGSYSESCRNVYKSMTYYVNGRRTNLTGLIGECKRNDVILVKE